MCSAVTSHEEGNAAAASKSSSLDLATCTSSALAKYLIEERFGSSQEPSKAALAFLQAATQTLQKADTAAASPNNNNVELGDALLATPLETSLMTPRAGKCQIMLHPNGLCATSVKDPNLQLILPQDSVSHVVLFAKPEDCKTIQNNTKGGKIKHPNAHLVLLRVDPPINFQNKQISQVCFALSHNKTDGPTGPNHECGWIEATAAWKNLLQQSFRKAVVAQVHPESSSPFLSHQIPDQSTTTGGMPFVKCYHGVQDGVLYPLQEGLLFYKPFQFLPRSSLHSIACGRGAGGQNASRYVDLVVELSNERVEFSNIQREEVGVLNNYIQTVLIPAMKEDVQTTPCKNDDTTEEEEPHDEEEEDNDDDDISDEEDEVFVAEGDSDEEEDGAEEESGSEKDDDSAADEDDDDDEFEVVDDDFAKELVKQSKESEGSATESEDDEQPGPKRRRTRGSG